MKVKIKDLGFIEIENGQDINDKEVRMSLKFFKFQNKLKRVSEMILKGRE